MSSFRYKQFFIASYLLQNLSILLDKHFVNFLKLFGEVYLDSCLVSRFLNDLFKVLIVQVFSLNVTIGRDRSRGCSNNDLMSTLEVF